MTSVAEGDALCPARTSPLAPWTEGALQPVRWSLSSLGVIIGFRLAHFQLLSLPFHLLTSAQPLILRLGRQGPRCSAPSVLVRRNCCCPNRKGPFFSVSRKRSTLCPVLPKGRDEQKGICHPFSLSCFIYLVYKTVYKKTEDW